MSKNVIKSKDCVQTIFFDMTDTVRYQCLKYLEFTVPSIPLKRHVMPSQHMPTAHLS